jgi:hypothetical protein
MISITIDLEDGTDREFRNVVFINQPAPHTVGKPRHQDTPSLYRLDYFWPFTLAKFKAEICLDRQGPKLNLFGPTGTKIKFIWTHRDQNKIRQVDFPLDNINK